MKFQKITDKYFALLAERESLDQAEPNVRAEAQKMITELTDKIDPAKLILLDGKSADLDDETNYSIRVLSGLRMKLDLIPGVRVRLGKKMEDASKAIVEESPRFFDLILAEIELKSEEDKTKTGDLIEDYELREWRRVFKHYSDLRITSEVARRLVQWVEAFRAGKEFRNVSK